MSTFLEKIGIKPLYFIILIWVLFLFVWIGFYSFGKAIINNTNGDFGSMPSFEILENPSSEYTSHVYSGDGVLLGSYFRSNRTPIAFDSISKNVQKALLATEDVRFYEHSGMDRQGIMAIPFYLLMGQKRGASTITQQLAKNLFRMRKDEDYEGKYNSGIMRMVLIKVKEWITAVRLEMAYTKKEIMAMYLNTVDFGSNAFGLQVASQTFFGKDQAKLEIQEAAVLTGLLKGPSWFSPISQPKRCLNRRNTVLDQLEKYDFLSEEKNDSLQKLPLGLTYNVENHNDGIAPYFRTVLKNYLVWWCKQNGYDLFADGLKIYTTVDSRMQVHAEKAVQTHLTKYQDLFFERWKGRNPWTYKDDSRGYVEIEGFLEQQLERTDVYKSLVKQYNGNKKKIAKALDEKREMQVFSWHGDPKRNFKKDTTFSLRDSLRYYLHFLHTGVMSMDPHSGEIKAWVGGINHEFFKFDHVRQGKRQTGSTFKPIVYATILGESGGVYSPCFKAVDAPVTFYTDDPEHPTWTPQNAMGEYSGNTYTLRQAQARSINSITAYMMKLMGDQTPVMVKRYAENLGITSHLEAVPAMCLGTFDVSVFEMVGAYATFVNKGVYTKPYFISKIEDRFGNVIFEFPKERKFVISEELANTMLYMLRGGTEESGGTAQGLRNYDGLFENGNQIGGKTGTTQNGSDGWFMGVTEDLVTGVWVGADHRSIHFPSLKYGQGGRMAMPIFGYYMEDVYKDKKLDVKRKPFHFSDSQLPFNTDCSKVQVSSDTSESNITVPAGDLGGDGGFGLD